MSVCTIVLSQADCHQMSNVLVFLDEIGVSVDDVNHERGVIECSGDANLIRGLEHAKLFEYVRVTMTYAADFPVGHPKDTNGK